LEIRVLEVNAMDLIQKLGRELISIQNSSISGELPEKFPDISGGIQAFGPDQENAELEKMMFAKSWIRCSVHFV